MLQAKPFQHIEHFIGVCVITIIIIYIYADSNAPSETRRSTLPAHSMRWMREREREGLMDLNIFFVSPST